MSAPRKSAAQKRARKDELLRVRVTEEQKEAFIAAAERAGISLSSWIVATALAKTREAPPVPERKPLAKAGAK